MVRHPVTAEFGESPVRHCAFEDTHRESLRPAVVVPAGAVAGRSGSACPLLAPLPGVKIAPVRSSCVRQRTLSHQQASVDATCCRTLRSTASKEST